MSVTNKIKKYYSQISTNSGEISKKTGKSKFLLEADMLGCLLKYSASPNNYKKFEFYNLKSAQRSTYVTFGISQKMIHKFNDPAYIDIFENKFKFAEVFSDMYGRGFLNTSKMTYSDFEAFCNGKEKIICKPTDGSQGANIKVYHICENLQEIYDEIKKIYSKNYMLEEWIEQHEVLSKIYPKAVNCLRIISVYDGKTTDLLTGGVTFGINDEIANGSLPSIVAPVDFNTGILYKPAASFGTPLYENHPTTGARILDVQLPYWDETVDLIKSASVRVPQVGYIGWDVAITPNGPVLIEGNTTPGYIYYQIPNHLPNGIGNKEKYIKYLR